MCTLDESISCEAQRRMYIVGKSASIWVNRATKRRDKGGGGEESETADNGTRLIDHDRQVERGC